MCFELYYLAMNNAFTQNNNNGTSGDDRDGLDTSVAILLLVQNTYVFLSVSLHGAHVAQEGQKSLDILKTKGFFFSKENSSVHKRHLILSLQMSLQQKMCLSGGHYFILDKPFIVRVKQEESKIYKANFVNYP